MKRTMVLLGAGASAEAGVPTAFTMTDDLLAFLSTRAAREPWYECCAQLLRSIIGSLVHRRISDGSHLGIVRVDVEEVVSTVRLLHNRRRSRLAPFVHWQSIVDLRRVLGELNRGKGHISPGGRDSQRLIAHLCEMIGARASPDTDVISDLAQAIDVRVAELASSTFWEDHLLAWSMHFINEYLDSVLWVQSEQASYLAPLASLANKQGSLAVATLNYDLSVEASCEGKIACDAHAMTWYRESSFPLGGDGITLLKLHGSINWKQSIMWWPEHELARTKLMPRAKPLKPEASWVRAPYLIFGSDEKLRSDGPFLDLLFAYRQALADCDRLLVVGYSFRDDHINEPLRRWFNADGSHELVIIDPGFRRGGEVESPSLPVALAGYESAGTRQVRVLRESASVGLAQLQAEGIL